MQKIPLIKNKIEKERPVNDSVKGGAYANSPGCRDSVGKCPRIYRLSWQCLKVSSNISAVVAVSSKYEVKIILCLGWFCVYDPVQ